MKFQSKYRMINNLFGEVGGAIGNLDNSSQWDDRFIHIADNVIALNRKDKTINRENLLENLKLLATDLGIADSIYMPTKEMVKEQSRKTIVSRVPFYVNFLILVQGGILFIPALLIWLYSVCDMAFIFDWDSLPISLCLLLLSALKMAFGWQLWAIYDDMIRKRIKEPRYRVPKWLIFFLPLLFVFILILLYIPIACLYDISGQTYSRFATMLFLYYALTCFIIYKFIPPIPENIGNITAFSNGYTDPYWTQGRFIAWIGCLAGGAVGGSILVVLLKLVSKWINLLI